MFVFTCTSRMDDSWSRKALLQLLVVFLFHITLCEENEARMYSLCLRTCKNKLVMLLFWICPVLTWYQAWLLRTIIFFVFSVQFSSVAQLRLTLCDPMSRSTPGLPVHHHLREFTQTQVHRVGDAIQPSHPLSSPFPPAPDPSQHHSLFQWVNSSHEVARVLEFQL